MSHEQVLLVVHKNALIDWSKRKFNGTDGPRAIALLQKINSVEPLFLHVIHYELDPWEPEWNSNPSYSWKGFASQLTGYAVTVAGIQRHMYVEKVADQLLKEGLDVSIDEQLVMDSDYLK